MWRKRERREERKVEGRKEEEKRKKRKTGSMEFSQHKVKEVRDFETVC